VLKERDAWLWRYEELLPIATDDLVTLGEGWTPLTRAKRLGEELQLNHLFIKDERQSPTGSFKDRQGVMAINILKQQGLQEIVLASTGNKAAAYAAYCARAGIRLWIFLTSMVPNEKLRELALYGAEVIKITGTYDQAKQVAKDFAQRRRLYYDAGLSGIAGREGLKTIAYEIAEQLSRQAPLPNGKWATPDWYIQAVSGGIGPIAIYGGFQQLLDAGLIERIPRLAVIQVEGCSPMVAGWEAHSEVAPAVTPRTRITVLSSGDPGRGYKMLRRIALEAGGTMLAVSDGEAFRAMRRLARVEGYSVEPAAAVAFAGLEKMVAEGIIHTDEYVVVNCSGHTFPAEKHILEDQYTLDLQLGQQEEGVGQATQAEEGLAAALERLDEQVTTIVVIDDNPQDSRLIRRLLQSYKNYRIFEAQNPLDGLDLVKQRKPDLVLSDLTMPEMDGFDLLEALKADPDTANIPVIVISAKTLTPSDMERLEKAQSVWQKGNFNTRQLVNHVVKTLGDEDGNPLATSTLKKMTTELESLLESVNRQNILVVDDNRKDARLIKRILEATQRYIVHEAYSASEALENLPQVNPKLIVVDLMLPDMAGQELIQKIRAQLAPHSIPMLILTAKSMSFSEEQQLTALQIPIWYKADFDRQAMVELIDRMIQQNG
jgi:threonine synthase